MAEQVIDLWEPMTLEESAQDIAEQRLRRKYTDTRVDRAMKRKVAPYISPGIYTVEGDSKLGDCYPYYTVSHDPAKNSFHCTCHTTKHGDSRASGKFLCTHGIAVDYYLTTQRLLERIRHEKNHGKNRQPEGETDSATNNEISNFVASVLLCPSSDSSASNLSASNSSASNSSVKDLAASESQSAFAPSALSVPFAPAVPVASSIPAFSDPMWRRWNNPSIPSQFQSLRPHQWMAIKQVVAAMSDPNVKVVFVDAPTGSGKTLIGECVRRLCSPKTLYLCTTKTLQDQVLRDFPYAKLLKGRANYPTQLYPDRFRPGDKDPYGDSISCADCAKRKVVISCEEANCHNPYCEGGHWKWVCPLCDNPTLCAYGIAKTQALNASLAVLNTSYYLTEANGPGSFGGGSLIILDEADTLERILLNHVEIRISATVRKRLNLVLPEKKTVPAAWDEWVKNKALPAVEEGLNDVKARIKSIGRKSGLRVIKEQRWERQLTSLKEQLSHCELANGDWIYCYTKASNPDIMPVVFRPIKVDWCAKKLLWDHCEKWVLLSATFIDAYGMAEDLGLSQDEIRIVSVANTFPKERRPVYVIPRANMSYRTKQEEMPAMVAAVKEVMEAHPDERILIHSVSYDLTNALIAGLQSQRVFTYKMAAERNAVLESFKNTPAAVLIAPSLDRGVDLPDDDCRVVVVAKVPFPDLSDKQTNARLYSKGGSRWYAATTVRTIAQMTGRAMRSKDDYCDIYILDTQFLTNLWSKSKYLFPSWWREAVVMSGSPKVGFKRSQKR